VLNESSPRELELTVRLDGQTIHTGRVTLPDSKPIGKPSSADLNARLETVAFFGVGLKIPPDGPVCVVVCLFTDPTREPQVAFVQVNKKTQYVESGTVTHTAYDVTDYGKALRDPLCYTTRTIFDANGEVVSHRVLPKGGSPKPTTPSEPGGPPDDPHVVG